MFVLREQGTDGVKNLYQVETRKESPGLRLVILRAAFSGREHCESSKALAI
jgi:hypothetical protein